MFVQNVLPPGPIAVPSVLESWGGAAMPVKIRVQRCKFPGWTYIDSDQSLLVDAGEEIEVQVVAPESWQSLPSPLVPAELPALLTFVDVKVRACVLTCCPPRRSTLTLYGDFNTFVTGLQQLRPRRATELWIASGSGGAPALSTWHWSNVEGTFNGGNFNINGGFVSGVVYPGNLEVIVYDDLGQNDIVMVWRIE
jgi:hypothetical protein